MNNYTLVNAYDERNRRIFKSFKDTDLDKEAQWFFYYDQFDRLVQVKHTPDISDSDTYTVYQWYWLDSYPILYYQVDYPGATTTRRYLYWDEQGRPHAAWSWPSSGDTQRVWEVEAGTFGWDVPLTGTAINQPLRFRGQQYDADTESITLGGGGTRTVVRPGLSIFDGKGYDGLTGVFSRPAANGDTIDYGYAEQSPVTNEVPVVRDGRTASILALPIDEPAMGESGDPPSMDAVLPLPCCSWEEKWWQQFTILECEPQPVQICLDLGTMPAAPEGPCLVLPYFECQTAVYQVLECYRELTCNSGLQEIGCDPEPNRPPDFCEDRCCNISGGTDEGPQICCEGCNHCGEG